MAEAKTNVTLKHIKEIAHQIGVGLPFSSKSRYGRRFR